MLKAPRNATVGLTPRWRAAMPVAPERRAKKRAARRVIRCRTSGRLRVRDMRASVAGSYSMLRALADEEQRAVPAVRKARVSGEREGAVEARAVEERI